jgi:hypothetical protein
MAKDDRTSRVPTSMKNLFRQGKAAGFPARIALQPPSAGPCFDQ